MRVLVLLIGTVAVVSPVAARGGGPVGVCNLLESPTCSHHPGALSHWRGHIVRVQAPKEKDSGPPPPNDTGVPEPPVTVSRPDAPDDGAATSTGRAPLQTLTLFGSDDRIRIQSLAAKHGMLVPEFEFRFPGSDVPVALRRLIGVWIDETGNNGKGRRTLVIVTGVEPPGTVRGFLSVGPSDATSFSKGPATYFGFEGSLEGLTVRFQNAKRTANYSIILNADNVLLYHYANIRGQRTSRTLRPLWMLTLAERAMRP